MRKLREKVGLRTVDVASRIGVGESTVRNWEHGRTVPKFEVIAKLLDLYQCSFEDLDQAVRETRAAIEKAEKQKQLVEDVVKKVDCSSVSEFLEKVGRGQVKVSA
jgi:transcriptional regulator with XRE-family HTH domain